ncbi:MAG: phosphoglycerate kinase [bacterium]|nr:phosphoglycerate kinase [bacterium]
MKSVRDINVEGKKVLVRVDLNVPLKDTEMGNKEVVNDSRIRAVLPTIKYLIEKKAKVIILSHLGRPDGKVVKEYALDPVILRLQELLGTVITHCGECDSKVVKEALNNLKEGEVLSLGNLRFHSEEEKNDQEFAKKLASLGDIYVNDAFAVSHRAHASVEAITHFLPSYAGFLMEKELNTLSSLIKNPVHPFVLIMGGAKAADKIPVIMRLENQVDGVMLGGVVADTFLAANGEDLGSSKIEKDRLDEVRAICNKLKSDGKELYLPSDLVVSPNLDGTGEIITMAVGDKYEAGWKALDIGQSTVDKYRDILLKARTIFWNGNMGMSEVSPFDEGTRKLAGILAEATDAGAKTVICGGDTTGLVDNMGLSDKMTYLSTGGGAALEFLAGLELPGVKALEA